VSFQQYLKVPTVVDLSSKDKVGAITELAQALLKALGKRRQKPIVEEILKREESASTFIGQGIAIPQTRGPIEDDFAVVVGRSLTGVNYDAARGARARIIVLVISKDNEANATRQVSLLSEIAYCFKSDIVREQILSVEGPVDIRAIVSSFDQTQRKRKRSRSGKPASDPVLTSAASLARDIKARAIVVFADAVRENDFLDKLRTRLNVLVVTANKTRFSQDDKRIAACIQAPPFKVSRIGQIKIGILLALSRNLISRHDKVVCISGNSKSGQFDTMVALDIAREYEFFFTASQTILPGDVKPEVLERVLGIAGEIAVEGREGKPTGTIFVLGDTNTVNLFARQLIINPFRGYSEAERSIMDPGLDETIKEFASIDGAFVITGDGVVLSAGTYLRPDAEGAPLPSGFGARHVASAGITACTKALAITISESTGTVTLFRNGQIMMSLSKPVVRGQSTVEKVLETSG